jgi:hypothetical protein
LQNIDALIRHYVPEVADMGLGIPFPVESPKGIDGMELGLACSLLEVIGQPTAVASVSATGIIVGTQSPRTGVEHFVGVSIMDVLVEDVL